MPLPIPAPRTSGFTTTTDVPLYWAAYGPPGAPQLLVLHGGPGADHEYLLPQMLQLADRFELVFYDQRGGGRSRVATVAPITWRTHVRDLALVAQELGLDPLSLVGYSWGGLLAMLYAIETGSGSDHRDAHEPAREERPRNARAPARLVLIDPAPITRPWRDQFAAELARRQNSEPIRGWREALSASGLREHDPDAYRQRAFELGVAGYFAHPERAHDLTPFRVIGRVQQSVWASLGDTDVRSGLARVSCPTLILHGDRDPIPLASSESAARTMPRARLVVLDDSGHVPYVEAPDALFDAIRAFLDATAPGRSHGARGASAPEGR